MAVLVLVRASSYRALVVAVARVRGRRRGGSGVMRGGEARGGGEEIVLGFGGLQSLDHQ